MIGKVNVDSLTGFSQALAPQLPVASADEDVVVDALRASITWSGTSILIIGPAIVPTARRPTGIRGPSLTISATTRWSMLAKSVTPKIQVSKGG